MKSGLNINLHQRRIGQLFDHVIPICMFDVSDNEELKLAFNWKNTQPLLEENHSQKGVKFNFLDYQLQFNKAYQFLKLNEEGVI